jgi:hypothetical protein
VLVVAGLLFFVVCFDTLRGLVTDLLAG